MSVDDINSEQAPNSTSPSYEDGLTNSRQKRVDAIFLMVDFIIDLGLEDKGIAFWHKGNKPVALSATLRNDKTKDSSSDRDSTLRNALEVNCKGKRCERFSKERILLTGEWPISLYLSDLRLDGSYTRCSWYGQCRRIITCHRFHSIGGIKLRSGPQRVVLR